MIRKASLLIILVICCGAIQASGVELTLDSCLARAERHYPLIRQYGLLDHTEALSLSDINKSWLPRIGLYGQATVQNSVPALPEAFSDMMKLMGQAPRGLGKEQYKVGLDVSQTIWDGGESRHRRRTARAETASRRATLDVELYAVRSRVEALYFGILLLDRQIEISKTTETLLRSNLGRLNAMVANGTAMAADADMVEAQLLANRQQTERAEASRQALKAMLAIFIGEEVADTLAVPEATMPAAVGSERPEERAFQARIDLNMARLDAVDASLMPRVGLFAQGYYGYPGLNYFESMMNRNLSFNIMAGVKVAWQIDAFYTRSNSRRRIALENASIEAERATFRFNNSMEGADKERRIEGMRRVMTSDARIVELRASVRRAAESQLREGVIDATALLTKITDESQARLNASYHEIELIQNIYNLKHILNR